MLRSSSPEVVRRPVGAGGVDGGQRLGGVCGRCRFHAVSGEHSHQHLTVRRVVVDDQRLDPVEVDVSGRGDGAFRSGERQDDGEGAADPQLARRLHGAAHQGDELPTDSQPEAGASEATRGRCVGLGEPLEQTFQRGGIHPDPGVPEGERDHDLFGVGIDDADVNTDLTLRGELHRVAEEVDEHLSQAHGISPYDRRKCRVDRADQLDAFLLRVHRDEAGRVLHDRPRVVVDDVDLELAGLDLREVEDVVDDRQEPSRGRPHRVGELALLQVQRRVEEE